MIRPLIVFLLIIFVALIGLNWAIRLDPSGRNVEVMAEMVNSPAYKAQAENTAIAGGNASLKPVAGTIARGFMPVHYNATSEKGNRIGTQNADPIAAGDTMALNRGAVVFGNFCAVCHGPSGLGDGTVTQRGFPPPPSFFAESAMDMEDGKMFQIATIGRDNMPGYAAQVPRTDRWCAILYIRSLQKEQSESLRSAASAAAAKSQTPQEKK